MAVRDPEIGAGDVVEFLRQHLLVFFPKSVARSQILVSHNIYFPAAILSSQFLTPCSEI